MESSRLLDSARDPYARRQTPSMPLSSSLSSGQSYYTVESLEGASSLPLLSSAPPASSSFPSERDAFLRWDAKRRALLAEKESLDDRARLLAAERQDLLRRSLPADQRPYASGLPAADARTRLDGLPHVDARLPPADARLPVDARTRLDGLPRTRLDVLPHGDAHLPPADARLPPVDSRTSLGGLPSLDTWGRPDGLPPLDTRTRILLDEFQTLQPRSLRGLPHELDAVAHDSLWPGARAQPAIAGLAVGAQDQRSFSGLIQARELAVGGRTGGVPHLPAADSLYARRDIGGVHAAAMPSDSSLALRGFAGHLNVTAPRSQINRPPPTITREPAAVRPVSTETVTKQNKGIVNVKAPIEKSKPPPQQSEGWCAVCKIDCHNIKTLGIHLKGKRHKEAVEGNTDKVNEATQEGKSAPAKSQADKKRAIDAKPETSENVKRQKTTASAATGNNASKPGAADAKKLKMEDSKKENAKKPVAQNGKDGHSMPVCEVCNIFVTGQKNLETHLKGKRHALRVRQLAGIS